VRGADGNRDAPAAHLPESAAAALEALATPPTFTVLVGARDEADVLPRLVRDVARQDHRSPDGKPLSS